ncbi:MAG: IS21-like element ISPsy14 family transposase [Candidatus Dormibacteria bacterium]
MRKVGEVLRLAAEGLSDRQISHSVGLARSTVGEYRQRAQRAGVSWPLPAELDSAALEERLFPRPSTAVGARPEPDWREVHRELKRKRHVTLQLLWVEFREVHPDGWAYSQFCAHYRRWLGLQDVVMRLEYRDGERLFVDFSGDTMPVVAPDTGEITQMQVFVAVLGASGYLYVEATRGQDLPSWLGAHVRALEFCGGSPAALVPDNLKSGVTKACWYDPEINPSYLELARHYGTVVLPTRPSHPRDKAIVEVGVQVAERWVLAPLRNRRFYSPGELNAAIAETTAAVNGRAFRGLPSSRRDLFLESEKAALRPLPSARYEFPDWKKAKLNIDYHVEFDHHYYSAPHRLVRQEVEVRATVSVVEIFHRGRRVASHRREHGRRRFITDPAHMPASHRAHLEWTPSRLIGWAGTVGASVAEVAETIMRTRPHPEHGYRACMGLMRLAKVYGDERLSAACRRALVINATSYRSVESILKNGLDRVPATQLALVVPEPVAHENVRGADYYRAEA